MLTHAEDIDVFHALFAGIGNRQHIEKLATWFATEEGDNEHWSRAVVFCKLAEQDQKVDWKRCSAYATQALDALVHVDGDVQVLKLRLETRMRLFLMARSPHRKVRDDSFDWIAKLASDKPRLRLVGGVESMQVPSKIGYSMVVQFMNLS